MIRDKTDSILTVIQLNVNSIRSKQKQHEFDEILKFSNPDIVLLSETNIKNHKNSKIRDYNLFLPTETEKGRGTAVLVRDNIMCELITKPKDITSIDCTIVKIR